MQAEAYYLDKPGHPLIKRELILAEPEPDEALVEIKACGLCHTDLGYANGSVPPRHPLPLVLGHEVMGIVKQVGEQGAHLLDCPVLVPAVLPCGKCPYCRIGRGNACSQQKMPGNDIHGGFATHMVVPVQPLVSLANAPSGFDLESLAVVADAVSTAYQAIRRSGLQQGDVAFVIGAGGVGGFVIQIAHALGAKVVAMDIGAERLEKMQKFGADEVVLNEGQDSKALRKEAHDFAKGWGISSLQYRIFECAGTPESQLLAYSLLSRASTLVQVGYSPQSVTLRLSNLMAFDATIHGTWGCPPELYEDVLQLLYCGQITVNPFVAAASMSSVNQLLSDMAQHRLTQRMVMDPKH